MIDKSSASICSENPSKFQASLSPVVVSDGEHAPTSAAFDMASTNDIGLGSDDDHDDDDKSAKGSGKSRRELPSGAVATLKAWLLSPEHFTHPYPTPQDQVMLMQKTGIDKKQLKNWFTNARRRIWKPMLKKQLEQGKLAATGAGGVAVPGVVPGLMIPSMSGQPPPGTEMPGAPDNPHSVQAMHVHYQQAVQQQSQPQPQQYDAYGNAIYGQQQSSGQGNHVTQPTHPGASVAQAPAVQQQHYTNQQYYSPQQYGQPQHDHSGVPAAQPPMVASTSIGSLAPMGSSLHPSHSVSGMTMSKNDSHAVLMELFARDQDLVRQASESAKMKSGSKGDQNLQSQHPMKMGSSGRLTAVPSLNSWPHFSSISSLNNLGTMTGVRSIASLSGADLASQGTLNKMGNLAQVKSIESMGRNDSYAFLEVFFGDRGSSTNLSGKDQRGVKRDRDEDNDVGLSLDGDEMPSTMMKHGMDGDMNSRAPGAPQPAPMPAFGKEMGSETGTLKRAYDDALAARGLISVSRSCEKLTDLALPAKMQRTLSQEYLRQQQQGQNQSQYGQYSYAPASTASDHTMVSMPSSQQYPGQHPGQHQQTSGTQQYQTSSYCGTISSGPTMSDPSMTNVSVEVPSATKCALCHNTNVDTQLRPCGHMFHERCLKPSLQTTMGQPKCPIDHIPMQSALLAVPTDENPSQVQHQRQPQHAWNNSSSVQSFQAGTPIPAEAPSS